MTLSAWSQETVRGSKPVRAGSSASPECGPEPVTIVPRTSTTAVIATTAQASRCTSGCTASGSRPPGWPERHTSQAETAMRNIDASRWKATIHGFRPVSTVMPPTTACACPRTRAGLD